MLTIFYEWKNSLTLCKKDTLLLLLYSWYKLTIQVYKDLFHYFWWLVLPFFGILLLQYPEHGPRDIFYLIHPVVMIKGIGTFILSYVLSYIVMLFARPTLEKKNKLYVVNKGFDYLLPVISAYFLYLVPIFVWMGIIFPVYHYLNPTVSFEIKLSFSQFIIWYLVLFFLFDSKGYFKDVFKAVWDAYKMILFNMPISILLVSFLEINFYVLGVISNSFPIALQKIVYAIMYPIYITLIATFYIKRVNDQCNLYVERGEGFEC